MSRSTRLRIHRTTPPGLTSRLRALAAAAATLVVLGGCGGAANGSASAPALQRVPSAAMSPGGPRLSRPLPLNWRITMKVWFLRPQSTLRIGLGSADVLVFDGSRVWHRVALTSQGLVVDGRRTGGSRLTGMTVTLRALHGGVEVRDLVIERRRG